MKKSPAQSSRKLRSQTLQQAFRNVNRGSREDASTKTSVSAIKSSDQTQLEQYLQSILNVFTDSDTPEKDTKIQDKMFLDAVQSISLSSNGKNPPSEVLDKLVHFAEESQSISSTQFTFCLLEQLNKRYPPSVLQKSESNSNKVELLVDREAWTPLSRKREQNKRGAASKRMADLGSFITVIEFIAKDLKLCSQNDSQESTNRHDQEITRFANYKMYAHLVSILSCDLDARLAVFKEHNQALILKDSMIANFTLLMPDSVHHEMWRTIMEIIAMCNESQAETNRDIPESGSGQSSPAKFSSHGQRSNNVAVFVSWGDIAALSQKLISYAMAASVELQKLEENFLSFKRAPFSEIIVAQWRDLKSTKQKISFISSLESKEQKLSFVLEAFGTYISKDLMAKISESSNGPIGLQHMLACASAAGSIQTLKRANLSLDVLAAMVLHGIDGHIFMASNSEGRVESDLIENENGKDLKESALAALDQIQTTAGKRISTGLQDTLKALETFVELP